MPQSDKTHGRGAVANNPARWSELLPALGESGSTSREAQALVQLCRAEVVGIGFDLDVHALRVSFELVEVGPEVAIPCDGGGRASRD